MQLKIKKLTEHSIVPKFAHEGDAGMDLYSSEDMEIKPGERVQIPTGIAMHIPDNCVGLIWDKSGLSHKFGLKTLGGVIDSGYRGEIKIGIINLSNEYYKIEKGHKVAQIIIQEIVRPTIEEVEDLEDSSRGENGFGSTGK